MDEMATAAPTPQGCYKDQVGSCRVSWPSLTQDNRANLYIIVEVKEGGEGVGLKHRGQ